MIDMHMRSAVAGAGAAVVAVGGVFLAVSASNADEIAAEQDAPLVGHYSTTESVDPIEYVPEPIPAPEPVVVEEPVVSEPAPAPEPVVEPAPEPEVGGDVAPPPPTAVEPPPAAPPTPEPRDPSLDG